MQKIYIITLGFKIQDSIFEYLRKQNWLWHEGKISIYKHRKLYSNGIKLFVIFHIGTCKID